MTKSIREDLEHMLTMHDDIEKIYVTDVNAKNITETDCLFVCTRTDDEDEALGKPFKDDLTTWAWEKHNAWERCPHPVFYASSHDHSKLNKEILADAEKNDILVYSKERGGFLAI